MHGPINATQQSKRNKGSVLRQLLLVSVGLIAFAWIGCSVENDYELLSTFFDGVPDPNAPKVLDRITISQSDNYSEHKPYIDDSCFECHTDPSDMTLSKGNANMCMKCHDEIKDQYPLMHGAVVGQACLMCHNPHYSEFPFLLRSEGPKICTQCHTLERESLGHPIIGVEQSCLECHHAHGGETPYFLLDKTKHIVQKSNNLEQPEAIDGQ